MNKKVGIVTLHGYSNYGNRLQNYALKKTLDKLKFNTDTIIIKKKSNKSKNSQFTSDLLGMAKSILKLLKGHFLSLFNKEIREISKSEKVREHNFREFSKETLSEKFYDLNNDVDVSKLEGYNYFITGSDQVWHPAQVNNLDLYFLEFADPSKRVAYSPSFAVDEIPNELKDIYRNKLNFMNSLSVREDTGSEIIKELINEEAPVVADPTVLLSKKEWLSVSKRASNRPETPYILTYFLGGPSNETRLKLEEIADEKGMTIINLGVNTEKETYETGPSEFLDYVNNASTFFTDSFHGVVFSIIFKTPFVVYERKFSGPSMYSRVATLLDKFSLRNREAKNFNGNIFEMDFTGSEEVLNAEYKHAIAYLQDALRIEE